MSRYIDADNLLSRTIYDVHHAPYITKYDVELEPTADVRENVHGEWKRNFNVMVSGMLIGNEFYWYCTHCKTEYYEEDLYMGGNDFPNFCPNCGADMRKGETNGFNQKTGCD